MTYYSNTQYELLKSLSKGDRSRPDLLLEIFGELENRRTTIYDNLVVLQSKGLVEKYRKNDGTQGRPPTMWRIKEKGIIIFKELESKHEEIRFN